MGTAITALRQSQSLDLTTKTQTHRNQLAVIVAEHEKLITMQEMNVIVREILNCYYRNVTDETAEDLTRSFKRIFNKYPHWAVKAAWRYYSGEHNPSGQFPPTASVLGARIIVEMEDLKRAKWRIKQFDREQELAKQREAELLLPKPRLLHEMTLTEFDAFFLKQLENGEAIEDGALHNELFNIMKTIRLKIVHREAAEECKDCIPPPLKVPPRK